MMFLVNQTIPIIHAKLWKNYLQHSAVFEYITAVAQKNQAIFPQSAILLLFVLFCFVVRSRF